MWGGNTLALAKSALAPLGERHHSDGPGRIEGVRIMSPSIQVPLLIFIMLFLVGALCRA